MFMDQAELQGLKNLRKEEKEGRKSFIIQLTTFKDEADTTAGSIATRGSTKKLQDNAELLEWV